MYYQVNSVCNILHVTVPPRQSIKYHIVGNLVNIFSAVIEKLGYRVSQFHDNSQALKTDAPLDVLWDIFRCWAKANPPSKLSPTSPAAAVLATQPKYFLLVSALVF